MDWYLDGTFHTYLRKERKEIPRRSKNSVHVRKTGEAIRKVDWTLSGKQHREDVNESMTGSAKVDGELRLVRGQ